MEPDIRAHHYTTDDRRLLLAAGDALIAWAVDLATHDAGDAARWDRTLDDDPVLTAGQLGSLIATTTTTLHQVITWYTHATLAARSRAAYEHRRNGNHP